MGRRGILLVTLIGVALAVASCGRASQTEIEQALGITPTATASAAQIATGTAAAAATTTAQTAVAAAPAGTDPAAEVALGDVNRGNLQFLTQCSGCHRPGGAGPDLLAAGGAGAGVTTETLLPLIRDGIGHPVPPGPYPATLLSDGSIADIAAYIAAQVGQ
jgi:mono/diheme cytochrome c family protein